VKTTKRTECPTRKAVQIAVAGDHLFVLCNDGTMWSKLSLFREWIQVDEIPQPEHENN
jgi:hypothetical protein